MSVAEELEQPSLGAGPRLFSAAEFAGREMKRRPELVPGWLPGCQVSSIDGPGGGGKSTVALQLCASVVSGRSWLDQQVQRGPAIYLASEDDADEIQRRLDAICVHQGLGFDDLADLHIWPLATDDPALVVAGQNDTLAPTARWSQLQAAVDRIRPVVLVLDSRADVFGGNEVSRSQARGFVALLRKMAVTQGVAIVMLGHPSLTGISSGSGSSGSTHWRNAVRAGLYLRPPEDPDASSDLRVLEVMKNNYGPAGLVMTLRWSAGAFVLEGGATPLDRKDAGEAAERKFMELLDAFTAEGRHVGDTDSVISAPKCFAADPRAGGIRKPGFKAAMGRLFADGAIRVEVSRRGSRHIVRVGA